MQYVKISQLKPGMRLARPIYNKMGVMLFERDTKLSRQGIASIENFGLWGVYILEPAEPVPPLTEEDIELERFLTVSTFRLKDDLTLLTNGMTPQNIMPLSQTILRNFGSLDHKIQFNRSLRSNGDYVYKHSLNTAILTAMMVHKLHYSYGEQLAIVCAALLHDMGLLLVPDEILEKGDRLLSSDERRLIRGYLEKGYHMLHPDYNDYKFPELTLQIVGQMTRLEHNVKVPLPKNVQWKNGTHVLHVASMFDELTSMNLDREPMSEIRAVRFLREHPDYYPAPFLTALTQCIHILPSGCCVDFSNGQKGIVVEENAKNYAQPVVILFSDNQRVDFDDAKFQKTMHIADVMKTMDLRLPFDHETLKKYASDPHIRETARRYAEKRSKLAAAGRSL
ncbi:MAG: HD domain-containing protein [Lachnospiraceae bacterium]|nr:HD domain-containing protein [Lachnospiraceae bacterium]